MAFFSFFENPKKRHISLNIGRKSNLKIFPYVVFDARQKRTRDEFSIFA